MPNYADADLLLKFTTLTGMHPDCPIPAYMRADANLFFTNFISFRGAWPHMAGLAQDLDSSASVAPTAAAGQSTTSALEPTGNAGCSQLASPPLEVMKVVLWIKNPNSSTLEPFRYLNPQIF